jgi:hypothetical protein
MKWRNKPLIAIVVPVDCGRLYPSATDGQLIDAVVHALFDSPDAKASFLKAHASAETLGDLR